MVYSGSISSAALIEGVNVDFDVDFNSIEGIQEITAQLHYSSHFVSVDATLDYHSGCDAPKLNGSAVLDLTGIFDHDIPMLHYIIACLI